MIEAYPEYNRFNLKLNIKILFLMILLHQLVFCLFF